MHLLHIIVAYVQSKQCICGLLFSNHGPSQQKNFFSSFPHSKVLVQNQNHVSSTIRPWFSQICSNTAQLRFCQRKVHLFVYAFWRFDFFFLFSSLILALLNAGWLLMEITYFHIHAQYNLILISNHLEQVMVQTSLDKEMMKSIIMTCANRVEQLWPVPLNKSLPDFW